MGNEYVFSVKQLKLGIVGCGTAMLCIHLPILQQLHDRFSIIAIHDSDNSRMVMTQQRIGGVKIFASYDDLLQTDIDAVVILTQNHELFIEKALSANKHIFTEKPISLDLNISTNLHNLALQKNLILYVGLMRMHDESIRKAFDQINVDTINTCLLFKADGSDSYVRQSLLPKNFAPYTFNKISSSFNSPDLNGSQMIALQILLWSGIHLMTTICQYFASIRPIRCVLNDKTVHCELQTKNQQSLWLHIIQSNVAVYREEIHLFAERNTGLIRFHSPYHNGMRTQFEIISHGNNSVLKQKENHFESSFYRMWLNFAECISKMKKDETLELALKVECLSKDIVECLIENG